MPLGFKHQFLVSPPPPRHHPVDVVAGAVLGAVLGWLTASTCLGREQGEQRCWTGGSRVLMYVILRTVQETGQGAASRPHAKQKRPSQMPLLCSEFG